MALRDAKGGSVVEFRPMSPEEIERTVQFLLHQQAQFAADFERLSAKTDRIAEGLVGLTGIVGHLTDHFGEVIGHLGHVTDRLGHLTDRLGDLTDNVGTLTDNVGTLTDRVDRLAAAQERTDHHMRELQDMFKRHLREDHGYGPT